MWVPFNEGWGQFDTKRIVDLTKQWDPSRLVDDASGWTDRACGDVHDMHNYPGPNMFHPEDNRATVLGEFGGLGLRVESHSWADKSWGYKGMKDADELTNRYVNLMSRVWQLKEKGLSAAVYTQITDVETECNGLLTYDRALIKVNQARAAAAARGETKPPVVILPTSQEKPQTWRYTLEKPADDWSKPDFDDSKWKQGEGGFGTEKTPGAVVRTKWATDDIWIRREFTAPDEKLLNPSLVLHHDDDAEIYINGVLAVSEKGYVSNYEEFPVSAEAKSAIKPGKNTLAVHCHQNSGGQYIDAGIVDNKEGK